MKKSYIKLLGCAALLAAGNILVSCDEVAKDDRYILGTEITAERTVLLEDFTGQLCVNCPEAHKVIEQLSEQYGDKLIAVSIHSGSLSVSTSKTNFAKNKVGLMTEEGNAIMESYGIQSFPMGTVNMGSPMTFDLWAGAVRGAVQIPSDIVIKLEAAYVPDTELDGTGENGGYFGSIDIKAEVLSEQTRLADVQFWVIESGIVATQKTLNGTVDEYVHNDVFRAQVFPGLKGNSLSLNAGLETDVEGSIACRWTDKERWNVKNMAVVAIVSDKSGVLQCAKVELFEHEEDTAPEE